jgi:TRAP-type C4-dicarboxylate transport system permease small subunit
MSEETGSAGEKGIFSKIGKIIGLAVDWFEVVVLSGGTAALAVILIANVIARSFFQSIYYAEEVSKFLIILITMVGVSYAARKARHIRMGAFFDLMPPKMEKVFVFVISAVSAGVLFFLAYYSYKYVLQMRMLGQKTAALQVPFWTFNLIVPIGFALAGIQYVRTILKNIVEKDVWLSPEQQSEYEDEGVIGY